MITMSRIGCERSTMALQTPSPAACDAPGRHRVGAPIADRVAVNRGSHTVYLDDGPEPV